MSANWKRLTGGSLLSSRVSARDSPGVLAVASAAAGLSALSPVHADSARPTASERSRACGFFTVTWISGPRRGHWMGRSMPARGTVPGIGARYPRVRRVGGVEGQAGGPAGDAPWATPPRPSGRGLGAFGAGPRRAYRTLTRRL